MCKIHSHSEDTIVHRDHIHMQQTYCEAPSHSLLYAIFGYFFLFFRLSPTLPRKSFFFSFVLRMKRTHSNEHACVHMPKARPNVCKNKTSNDDGDDKKKEKQYLQKNSRMSRDTAHAKTHILWFGVHAKARLAMAAHTYCVCDAGGRWSIQICQI